MISENRRKPLATITVDMSTTNVTAAYANFGAAVALLEQDGTPSLSIADSFEVINPQAIPVQFEIVKAAAPTPTQVVQSSFGLGRESVGIPVASGDQFKVKSRGATISAGVLVINIFKDI